MTIKEFKVILEARIAYLQKKYDFAYELDEPTSDWFHKKEEVKWVLKKLEEVKQPERTNKGDSFEKELMNLINRFSMENGSYTPDYILAGYLIACLDAFNKTACLREK